MYVRTFQPVVLSEIGTARHGKSSLRRPASTPTMNVKVYGFNIDTKLPSGISRTCVYEYMAQTCGSTLGKFYRYGAKKLNDGSEHGEWWAGIILKVRDSKAFTKLVEGEDGKAVLTAETLAENEKLVEISYFVAHPQTGSGLMAHHYQATSLWGFSGICQRLFVPCQKAAKAAALAAATGLTKKQKKELRLLYKTKFKLGQLCNDTDLKTLVKQLNRVSTFELRLSTVRTKERFLRGIAEKADSEIIKLVFPADESVADLADDAEKLSTDADVDDIKVTGVDSKKKRQESFKDKNPLLFDEYDYDKLMKGFNIDLGDWGKSIEESTAIKRLIATAKGTSTYQLLTKA